MRVRYDPVANLLNRYFTVSTTKRVIDDSPGEDEGEIDHLGRKAAVEYLLMPERVKNIEKKLNIFIELDKISGIITKTEEFYDDSRKENKMNYYIY